MLSTNDLSLYITANLIVEENPSEFVTQVLSGRPDNSEWRNTLLNDGRMALPKATDRENYNSERHDATLSFEEKRQSLLTFLLLNQTTLTSEDSLTKARGMLTDLFETADELPSSTGGYSHSAVTEQRIRQVIEECGQVLSRAPESLAAFRQQILLAEQNFVARKDVALSDLQAKDDDEEETVT
ncbi:MAG: hypothetical protein LBU11_01135 [Zoogloeaceae bacterium]|jgi:hypothetical protein|nr:hypothetical protein [Zoogloeaceae bacterium]